MGSAKQELQPGSRVFVRRITVQCETPSYLGRLWRHAYMRQDPAGEMPAQYWLEEQVEGWKVRILDLRII